ncbi:MAG: endonuclease/exonuclease/phosphatase family protein [Anaerolineae bacterium]
MMRVLSLNIWGAPYARHRRARVAEIVDALLTLDPDVILLQEVYLADNFRQLRDGLGERWSHYRYFPSGLVGSGLLTFSKYLIVGSNFHAFRMRGKPDDIGRGDYYAQKGVGLTRILVDEALVDVYNVHTHAQYDFDKNNEYAVYNETNLYEVTRFVYQHSSDLYPVVLGGDLNTRPDQDGYRIVMDLGDLLDVGFHLVGEHSVTFSQDNPYVESVDQCLDYLLVRKIRPIRFDVVLRHVLTGDVLAYSDHYGVLVDLDLGVSDQIVSSVSSHEILLALYTRVQDALLDVEVGQSSHLERALFSCAGLFDTLLITSFLRGINHRLAVASRRTMFFGLVVYFVWQIVQVILNLQPRKRVLEDIAFELREQLRHGRLFDGRSLE